MNIVDLIYIDVYLVILIARLFTPSLSSFVRMAAEVKSEGGVDESKPREVKVTVDTTDHTLIFKDKKLYIDGEEVKIVEWDGLDDVIQEEFMRYHDDNAEVQYNKLSETDPAKICASASTFITNKEGFGDASEMYIMDAIIDRLVSGDPLPAHYTIGEDNRLRYDTHVISLPSTGSEMSEYEYKVAVWTKPGEKNKYADE